MSTPTLLRRSLALAAGLAAVLNLAAQPAQKEKDKAPPESPAMKFFEPASFAKPKLSPNGRYIGALVRTDDVHNALIMIDTEARTRKTLIQSPGFSVTEYWWKTDTLLLALIEENSGTRTFRALDLKTQKVNDLEGIMRNGAFILDLLPDDPENVVVAISPLGTDNVTSSYTRVAEIARVNLRTGGKERIEDMPSGGGRVVMNHEGVIIAIWGQDEKNWILRWRHGAKDPWQVLTLQPNGQPLKWELTGLAPDEQRLIVTENQETDLTRACYFDPATGKLEEIPNMPAANFVGVVGWGSHHQHSILSYRVDDNRLRFLAPAPEETYAWLNTLFPGTHYECSSFSNDDQRVLVHLWSDQNPGVYFLADRAAKKASAIGVAFRALNPNQMAPRKAFQFPTSDGLTVTGQITLPAGVKTPPLIVVANGIDSAPPEEFDALAQFFASRGYATAYINHRGTDVSDRKFAIAGDLQIATGMGRDLAEGVKWLGAQGLVDSHRAALFASGKGTLVAFPLAANAEVFRALVGYDAELNIANWQPLNFLRRAGRTNAQLLDVIGGKKGLEVYRQSVDPITAAGKVTVPAFYFFWRNGLNNVPQEVKKLESLLKKNGQNYQLVTADSRGSWNEDARGPYPQWKENTRHFEEVAAFLDKNL